MYVPFDSTANGVNREYFSNGILYREINSPDDLELRNVVDMAYANVAADIAGNPRPYELDRNNRCVKTKQKIQ